MVIYMELTKDDLKIIRKSWEDEIIATSLYKFLKRKAKGKRKEIFDKLAEMEKQHALAWNMIAEKYFNTSFEPNLLLKLKIIFYKLLALITPLTFMIHYLEFDEREATLEYSHILSKFREHPETFETIKRIIYDEIEHEATFTEIIIGEKARIAKVKDAIYGMTDSLVEILALVIGLASMIPNPLTIGLAGMISAIGGTFSMTSGAYLSAKSRNDIYEGAVKEIEVKRAIASPILLKDLKRALIDRGIDTETAKKIVESLKDNPDALENLAKTLEIEETPTNPKEVATTTGLYYILGALPVVIPFFIGHFLSLNTTYIAIAAVILSSIVSFLAGIFTAILSGISIKRKAIENVIIIIGAAFATYTIGSLAKILLGIEI